MGGYRFLLIGGGECGFAKKGVGPLGQVGEFAAVFRCIGHVGGVNQGLAWADEGKGPCQHFCRALGAVRELNRLVQSVVSDTGF